MVVAGLVLLLPLAACVRLTALPFRSHAVGIVRCAPRQRNAGRHPVTMVSERHNQAYKESIKLFEPLPKDAPLDDVVFPLQSYVPGPAEYDGECLVHTTTEPLLTAGECQAIVDESEDWATRAGGWTSTRHFNHPTTDIPLAELPRTRAMLNTDLLPRRIYPMLGQAFRAALPSWRALRVADAFIVKYNAAGGQTKLAPHRDGSVLSFNIALNDRLEYEGGGTWFEGLGQSLPIDKGHVCCHASGVMHGGHPITSGVRYILVGFVIVEGYQNWGARRALERVHGALCKLVPLARVPASQIECAPPPPRSCVRPCVLSHALHEVGVGLLMAMNGWAALSTITSNCCLRRIRLEAEPVERAAQPTREAV